LRISFLVVHYQIGKYSMHTSILSSIGSKRKKDKKRKEIIDVINNMIRKLINEIEKKIKKISIKK